MKTKNRISISSLILIGLIFIIVNCCKKSDQLNTPVVFTKGVRLVTQSAAIGDGEITSNSGSRLTEQGFCWSTGHLPVITDYKIMMGFHDICRYSTKITGLSPQTDYYIRAYATNGNGTAYGEELSFTTLAELSPGETGTVADIEGNVYRTIGIGPQVWMAENLKTTRYSNGDTIRTTPPTPEIMIEELPNYQCAYDCDESNAKIYGRLYSWYVVIDSRNICPTGWHVPYEYELDDLRTYLGGTDDFGGKLKEAGTSHWLSPNYGATNFFGFTALPGGYLNFDAEFTGILTEGRWWLGANGMSGSNGAISWYISYNRNLVFVTWQDRGCGLSVRCLKNN